jgi:enoyl-CoA hydratase
VLQTNDVQQGFKAAVQWRDSGQAIPQGDAARELIAQMNSQRNAPAPE